MKYFKLILFFSVLANYSIAQNIAIGPGIYLRASKSTLPSEAIFTKGFGIDIVKFSNHRFFYHTGLAYLNNYRVDNREVYQDIFGHPVVLMPIKKRSYSYNYFAIPLSVNFLVFKKPGINLLLTAGGELSWLYRYKFVYETMAGNTNISAGQDLKDSNLNVHLLGGVGMYIPLSQKLTFIFRTQFIKVIEESEENKNVQPGYIGLNFNLFRNF